MRLCVILKKETWNHNFWKGKRYFKWNFLRSSIDRQIGSQSVNQIASTTWQKVISVPIERNLHISLEELFFSHVTWILPFFEKPTEPFSHSAFHFTRTFYQPSKKSPNRTIFFFSCLSSPRTCCIFAGDQSPPPPLLTRAWEVRTHAVVFRSQNYFAREGGIQPGFPVHHLRRTVSMWRNNGWWSSSLRWPCHLLPVFLPRKTEVRPDAENFGKRRRLYTTLGSFFLHRPVPQGSLSLFFSEGSETEGRLKNRLPSLKWDVY